MNETIGVKGGVNDKRRVMIITQKKLNLLRKYHQLQRKKKLKEKEKKVKQLQILLFFKSVPLLLSLSAIKTIVNNSKKTVQKEENISKSNEKKQESKKPNIPVILDHIVIKKKSQILKNKKVYTQKNSSISISKEEPKKEKVDIKNKYSKKRENIKDSISPVFLTPLILVPNKNKRIEEVKKQETKDQKSVDLIDTNLEKIQDRKIIEKYEEDLKSIRTDMKEIISDYSFVDTSENNIEINNAEYLLESIKLVIERLEQLKDKIKVSDSSYDDYFYDLIEKYTMEFKNKRVVDQVRDSPLYISIAEKLDLMDKKKEELKLELVNKQRLNTKNEKEFKSNYFQFEKFSKDLADFQKEQDKVLKEVKKNVNKTKNSISNILVKINALNIQSLLLLSVIATSSMRRPSVRNTKAVAVTTLTAIYFMNQMLKDKLEDNNKKVVVEKDYIEEIENSVQDIDDVISLIDVTSTKIDSLMGKIQDTFGEYSYLSECQDLLNNLERIKREVEEKKYEIQKIKLEQNVLLNQNQKKKTYDS